jgi:breast cancer 2 susceptibility protein
MENHVRWIVWKFASIERRCAHIVGEGYLSYDRVVESLKSRYEREIVRGERSPLRRILNRDVSARTMIILCVAQVVQHTEGASPTWTVELTDGWYSVQASLDAPLTSFVQDGRIKVGRKLLVSNANLLGFDEGVDPLDANYDAMNRESSPVLCLCANATRMARWDAKLGFVRPNQELLASDGLLRVQKVSDVIPSGGRVPLIDVLVVRRYPLMYREKKRETSALESTSDQKPRSFTESEELERLDQLEKRKLDIIDRVKDEVEAECIKVRESSRILGSRKAHSNSCWF